MTRVSVLAKREEIYLFSSNLIFTAYSEKVLILSKDLRVCLFEIFTFQS